MVISERVQRRRKVEMAKKVKPALLKPV